VTAVARIAAAAATVLVVAALGCNRRAPDACRDDVDCPPGFDCVSAACTRRARLTFGGAGGAAAPEAARPEAPTPPPRPGAPEAAPSPTPPALRPKVKPPVTPPVLPPPLPPGPEQRLPEWKQRLKNS